MKFQKYLYFLLVFFTLSTSHAAILEMESIDSFEALIPYLTSEDLVLFDFSETLVMPKDSILLSCGKECIAQLIHNQAPRLSKQEVINLVSTILLQRKLQLVEERSISLIQTLQNYKVPTFCLTALRTGSFGLIPRTEIWRKRELSSFGIDFREVFPNVQSVHFNEYKNLKHPPVYEEGVLCSGSVSKGETLAHFLYKMRMKPNRVIFIDNSILHHRSVEQWMKRLKIEYIGFHYLANRKHFKRVEEKASRLQIRYLIQNKVWLSDEEAAKMANS